MRTEDLPLGTEIKIVKVYSQQWNQVTEKKQVVVSHPLLEGIVVGWQLDEVIRDFLIITRDKGIFHRTKYYVHLSNTLLNVGVDRFDPNCIEHNWNLFDQEMTAVKALRMADTILEANALKTKPRNGDNYGYIMLSKDADYIGGATWRDTRLDNEHFNALNVFSSNENARETLNKIHKTFQTLKS